MFDVKIKVAGKTYTKTKPRMSDYIRQLEFNAAQGGKNFLSDPAVMYGVIDIICAWYGDKFCRQDILDADYELDVIYETYRKIESNITEVFTGVPMREALARLNETGTAQTSVPESTD